MTTPETQKVKLCAICGVVQPCPEHGRTPVTDEDFDELTREVAEALEPTNESDTAADPLMRAEQWLKERKPTYLLRSEAERVRSEADTRLIRELAQEVRAYHQAFPRAAGETVESHIAATKRLHGQLLAAVQEVRDLRANVNCEGCGDPLNADLNCEMSQRLKAAEASREAQIVALRKLIEGWKTRAAKMIEPTQGKDSWSAWEQHQSDRGWQIKECANDLDRVLSLHPTTPHNDKEKDLTRVDGPKVTRTVPDTASTD